MTHRNFLAILCMTMFPCGLMAADEAVAETQRTLKQQGFYFGNADGRMNEETVAALKRFQIRSGLPVTGERDAATSQALGKKTVTTESTADSAASMREIARNQEKSDREFLQRTEAAEREVTGEPTPQRAAPGDPTPRRAETAPPEPAVRPLAPKDTAELAHPPAAEIRRYIESYLDAAEAQTPEKEVSFYADRVDYFDSGRVTRQFVHNDQLKYYDRWPERRFEMIGDPQIERLDAQRAAVRFKIRYSLRGESKRAQGITENLLHLRVGGKGMEIVGIRERKLKE